MTYSDHIDKQAQAVIALDKAADKVRGGSGFNIRVSSLSGSIIAEYQLQDEFFGQLVSLVKESYADSAFLHEVRIKEVLRRIECAYSKCKQPTKG